MNSGNQKTTGKNIQWIVSLSLAAIGGLFMCTEKNPVVIQDITVPGVYESSIQVDSVSRWFRLYVPEEYDHQENRPLLICLHGGGGTMGGFASRRSDIVLRCEQENWLLVFPNGSSNADNYGPATWNATHCCPPAFTHQTDDTGFIRHLVDSLKAMLKVDTNRIYAMGHSNGGMMTHKLAAELPEIFAAVAPSAASIGGQPDSSWPVLKIQPSEPVPIIITHGMRDLNVNFQGGLGLNGIRYDLSFRESVLF